MKLNIISDYWAKQFKKMRTDSSYWINNEIVSEYVYKLITGSNKHWLPWLFSEYFEGKNFKNSLSICCGDGAHEVELYKTGKVNYIRGFDISKQAIIQANEKFLNIGAKNTSYLLETRDVNDIEDVFFEEKFELILSTGALHHVSELEKVIKKIKEILAPNGYFIIVEFVGAKKFQWTKKQIDLINDIIQHLDVFYLKDNVRSIFDKPSIEEMEKIDPSEAIRSDEVYKMVKDNFCIEYEKAYNGSIIHQLYPLLNTNLANKGNKDFDSIIKLLLNFENTLIKCNYIQSDFVFMICRK